VVRDEPVDLLAMPDETLEGEPAVPIGKRARTCQASEENERE
jgi:hypothetical protein